MKQVQIADVENEKIGFLKMTEEGDRNQ